MDFTGPKEQNFVVESAESLAIVSRKEAKEKGLKYYFTGKYCKAGHLSKRLTGRSECSVCFDLLLEKRKEYSKIYREKNKSKLKVKYKEYRDNNKETVSLGKANYRKNNLEAINKRARQSYKNNKQHFAEMSKRYQEENRDELNRKRREWYKRPTTKASNFVRRSFFRVRSMIGAKKQCKTFESLGYSAEELSSHIESQWLDGMSWSNNTVSGWHIDHIKSIKSFIGDGVHDPKIINALSNLQPLWAKDNLSKGVNDND